MLDVPATILQYWQTQETRPATASDIARLEQQIGGKLPLPYRDFLSKFGPKQFDMTGWSEILGRSDESRSPIEANILLTDFFDTHRVLDRLKVFGQPMQHYDEVGPRIPQRMLPIGEAALNMAGLVLLKLDPPSEGSTWYWDRVDETWGQGENVTLWFVGRDLNDMLRRVRSSSE